LNSITDAEIVHKISSRERSAFDLLYDRYASIIFNLCVRILNDRNEAEDVMQEIFLQVWREAGRFDSSRASVKTWLFTIARSRSLDRYRSRKNIQKRIDSNAAENLQMMASEEDLQKSSLLKKYVGTALGQLSEEQRKVLELSYYEGLTQEEISEKLKEPLGTIKSRIRSSLIKLRTVFSGGGVE
jgi:RNA polymerase sigma-70 factor, ECF subfamily